MRLSVSLSLLWLVSAGGAQPRFRSSKLIGSDFRLYAVDVEVAASSFISADGLGVPPPSSGADGIDGTMMFGGGGGAGPFVPGGDVRSAPARLTALRCAALR